MRNLTLLAATATLIAGCATDGGPNRYQTELNELEASCQARGGILQSTGSARLARPQEDYVCRVTGGPSERLQRPGG